MTGSVLVVDDEVAVGELCASCRDLGLNAMFVPQGQAALELLSRRAQASTRHHGQGDARMTDSSSHEHCGTRESTCPSSLLGLRRRLAQSSWQAAAVGPVLRKPVDPAALEAALARVLAAGGGYSSGTT